MAETTAAAYPDLLAPARRLGGRLAAQLEAERDRWALWIPVKRRDQKNDIVDSVGISKAYGRFLS